MPNKFAELIYNTFMVPCEKFRIISLSFSIDEEHCVPAPF